MCIPRQQNGRGRLLVVQKTGWGKSFVYFLATKLLREADGGLEFGFEHFDDVADILAGVRAAGGSIVDMALGKPDMEQVFVGIMNQN